MTAGLRFDDKQKTLVGGKYPNVDLADARAWRDNAKAQLEQGLDPRAVAIAEEEQARAVAKDTFEILARAWLANAKLHWMVS